MKKKTRWYLFAIASSLCILCAVAALAINQTDPQTRADKYAKEYDGSATAYLAIFNSTDCAFLQGQFDTAYDANQTSQPGTIHFKRSLGFMTAADERMREIGCYDK